jgi:hypothetical protein
VTSIPPELLALAPLSIAVGLDLYLTLLFLGAVPTTGVWPSPLPGTLNDLDSVGVLVMVGAFYILEFAAERFPLLGLAWNSIHAIIRPLSSALLALLLLDGLPTWLIAVGAVLAAGIASIVHAVRTGSSVLRWMGAGPAVSPLLVSLAEDVAVLALASLALDLPGAAFVLSAFVLVAGARLAPSLLRAFRFGMRLALERVATPTSTRRWRSHDELPRWLRTFLEDEHALPPGPTLRGAPAGAWGVSTRRRFHRGWLVIRQGAPTFVRRGREGILETELTDTPGGSITDRALFRRVDLGGSPGTRFVLVGSSGPSSESLRAEFDPRG